MPEKLRQLVENVDYELLMSITRSDIKVKKDTTNMQIEESTPWFLENVLEKGNYEVEIALLQVNGNTRPLLSMAHRGFEHLAVHVFRFL